MCRSDNDRHFRDLFNQGLATNQQLRTLISSTQLLRSGVKTVELSPRALEQIRSLVMLSDQATENEIRREILNSIAVEKMTARFEDVEMAHGETFSWLLDREEVRRPEIQDETNARENLVKWLLHGDGIFHISGKPGSGKSTLMKFLCENPATTRHLKIWAGNKTLVMTNFFFWALGTPTQRSMNGLMRSLLHATLLKAPELVHELFPDQWNSAMQRGPFRISDRDIATAFDSLTQTQGYLERYKFIFFIDGLDEYEGNPDTMVKQLFLWAKSNPLDFKICVSSRELLVFQERFAQCEKLRIHQITHRDIEAYVSAILADNEDFQSSQNKEKILQIADTIVDKADGVFLWVKVVARGLLEGLLADDRLEDLEQKIEELPRELDELYQDLFNKMLNHRFRLDRTRAMRTLLLMSMPLPGERRHPMFLIYYSFLDEPDNPDFTFAESLKKVSKDGVKQRLRKSRKQLCLRCFGLLEVVASKNRSSTTGFLFNDELKFIHRTVVEFLSKPKIQIHIQEECTGFDVCSFVLQSFLASVLISQQHPDENLNFDNDLRRLLFDNIIMGKGKINSRLLSRFVDYSKDSGLVAKVRILPYVGRETIRVERPLAEAMVLIAARLGIYEVSLGTNGSIVPIDTLCWLPKHNPIEMLAAMIGRTSALFVDWDDTILTRRLAQGLISAIAYMLKNRVSPNACLQGDDLSIWMHLISIFPQDSGSGILEPVMRLFLLYGADADMFLCLTPIKQSQTRYGVALELERRKMRNTLRINAMLDPGEPIIRMSKRCNWKLPLRDWVALAYPPNRVKTLQLLIDRNLGRDGPPTDEEIASLASDECLDLDFDKGIGFETGVPLIP